MKSIFLLTSGEYSDYSVHMAFPAKELADQACEMANRTKGYSAFDVEEYPLLEKVPKRVTIFNMSETQGFWTFEVWEHEVWEFLRGETIVHTLRQRPLIVRGLDAERVKKVYGDLLAERKAREEGLS